MGRKGSDLTEFLEESLREKKFFNLVWLNVLTKTFCLTLPHKTGSLEERWQIILKSWKEKKRKPYRMNEDYSPTKDCITSSLRNSDYFEFIKLTENKLVCRMLTKEEVQEKKRAGLKYKPKSSKVKKMQHKASSTSDSSGCDSVVNSPGSSFNVDELKGKPNKEYTGFKNDHLSYTQNSYLPANMKEEAEAGGNAQSVGCTVSKFNAGKEVILDNVPITRQLDKPSEAMDISETDSSLLTGTPTEDSEHDSPLNEKLNNIELRELISLSDEELMNCIEDIDKILHPVAATKIKVAEVDLPSKLYVYDKYVDLDAERRILVFKVKKRSASSGSKTDSEAFIIDDKTYKMISEMDYQLKQVGEDELWVVLKQPKVQFPITDCLNNFHMHV